MDDDRVPAVTTDASPDTTPAAAPAPARSLGDRLLLATVTVGLVVGGALTVYEIVDRPPVELGEERIRIEGTEAAVQVLATNTSDDVAYCVEVRVAALDGDGLDLQEAAVAEPTRGGGRIEPRETINFRALLVEMDETDIREQLDELEAYVDRMDRC